MQIKEIKWTEDIENELLIGSIEDCELFEIETVDNVIILTDITSFDITYPSTVEEAKKNAKEILNKFINKIIVQATINTAKTVIKTINKKVICDELPMKQITKSINSLLKKSDWVKGSGWKVKQTSNNIPTHFGSKVKLQHNEVPVVLQTNKFNTDNWKKQKRDAKGRFIPKKGK
mgnify:CR=1 FL=1